MVLTSFGLRLFLGQEIDERLSNRAFFRLKCSIMQKIACEMWHQLRNFLVVQNFEVYKTFSPTSQVGAITNCPLFFLNQLRAPLLSMICNPI